MVINKHLSFYLRNGWGTKIIDAVNRDSLIFSPYNEQLAVDNIGLGRVMIKALRYWSEATGLTTEEKCKEGIRHNHTKLFDLIDVYDRYFQKQGSLLMIHRNLARNKEKATAWYWAFNELAKQKFSKEEFVEGLRLYLKINDVNVKVEAAEKEFNCLKNTYIGNAEFDKRAALDEDAYPFLGPLHLLQLNEKNVIEKISLSKSDLPLPILIYSIAMDNEEECKKRKQISIDCIMEGKMQVGKYYNIKYSKLIEMLMEAENKGMLILSNNFGNRHIEFIDYDYHSLLEKYYLNEDVL